MAPRGKARGDTGGFVECTNAKCEGWIHKHRLGSSCFCTRCGTRWSKKALDYGRKLRANASGSSADESWEEGKEAAGKGVGQEAWGGRNDAERFSTKNKEKGKGKGKGKGKSEGDKLLAVEDAKPETWEEVRAKLAIEASKHGWILPDIPESAVRKPPPPPAAVPEPEAEGKALQSAFGQARHVLGGASATRCEQPATRPASSLRPCERCVRTCAACRLRSRSRLRMSTSWRGAWLTSGPAARAPPRMRMKLARKVPPSTKQRRQAQPEESAQQLAIFAKLVEAVDAEVNAHPLPVAASPGTPPTDAEAVTVLPSEAQEKLRPVVEAMVQQAWGMALRKRSNPAERESPYPQASAKGMGKGGKQGKGQADGDDLLAQVAAEAELFQASLAAAGTNVDEEMIECDEHSNPVFSALDGGCAPDV